MDFLPITISLPQDLITELFLTIRLSEKGSEHTNNIESLWSQMRAVSEFETGVAPDEVEEIQYYLHCQLRRVQFRREGLRDHIALILRANGVCMTSIRD